MSEASNPLPQSSSQELQDGFKSAMRRLASAVGVVTAMSPEGAVGMAATSITSLTLDPPTLLVCVNRSNSFHASLAQDEWFCVNLLSDHQREISAAFGGAVRHEDRFTIGHWDHDARGLPWLEEAQANLTCRIAKLIPYETHTIVIGQITAVRVADEVAPLIYQDGGYL